MNCEAEQTQCWVREDVISSEVSGYRDVLLCAFKDIFKGSKDVMNNW